MFKLKGVPYRSGCPFYLFCLFRTKKDATAIPNAASRPKCFKKLNEFPSVVFYSLAFTGYKMEINWDIATVTTNVDLSIFGGFYNVTHRSR